LANIAAQVWVHAYSHETQCQNAFLILPRWSLRKTEENKTTHALILLQRKEKKIKERHVGVQDFSQSRNFNKIDKVKGWSFVS